MENIDEDLEFKWLKKKGVGGKNKEVQFYESFIYDGVKYALYDCVYMYKEGLQEPYIAKLTKIWERKGNIKKVKVHWFFRPEEISKWLGNTKTLENEIFFASGEGHGLTNINSLESIAGACNVVCVSKDCRNPQPSAEELKAADFVFYRTFDVQSCTISDKMDDKVGELEIKYVFNQKEGEIPESIPKTKEDNTTSSEPQQLPTTIVPNKLHDDPNQLKRNITPTESDKLNDRPLKKLKAGGKNPPEEKRAETEVAQDSEKLTGMPSKKSKVDNTNKIQVDVNKLKGVETSGTNSEMGKTDKANKDDMKVSIGPVDNKVDNKERNKTPTGSDRLPNQPLKKQKSEVKNPPMVDNKSKHEEKLPADVNKLKGVETLGTNSEMGKTDKANKDDMKVSIGPVDNKVDNKERNKTPTGSDRLPNQPLKKQKSEVKNPPMVDNKSKHEEKLPADVNKLKGAETSGTNLETGKTDKADKDDMKVSIVPVDNKVDNKERNKTPTGSNRLPNQPLKKQKSDVKNPPMVDNKSKHEEKLPADVNKLKGAETLGTNSETGKTDKANKDDMKVSIVPVNNKVDNKEGNKTPTGSGRLPNQPLKKQKSDVKNPPMVDNKSKHEEKLPADVNNLKALGTSGATEEKLNQKNGKVSSKVTDDSEGIVIKKSKDDGSAKLPDNKKLGNSGSGKDLVANSSLPKGKSKSGLALNSTADNKESKEEKSSENKRKLTVNKSFKAPASLTDKEKKSAYQEFVCGPKPNDDKSSWFRQLPWDERLKTAYDQGTAILLHNVDPDYTSAEIEDIIWHAFNEICGAKIVQRTAVSSPHYAQAIILLKTKEAAQKILVKLDEECLMLSNGRPLVATNCPPMSKKKNSSFFGHLKIKVQNQRDVDEAVSTSHFSQPNTIEYDMAMDWCLLQLRSKKWWDKLHKLQGLELKNLEPNRVQK